MCHEYKPHVKLWLSLIQPAIWKSINAFDSRQHNIDDADLNILQEETSGVSSEAESAMSTATSALNKSTLQDVPLLLRDPIAILLLIISNLPVDLESTYFDCLISNVFNLVFVQSAIDLCLQFDDDERQTWANSSNNSDKVSLKALNIPRLIAFH